jgi:hypothetical protein
MSALSRATPEPSFLLGVLDVVGLGAEKQVGGEDAWRVIAVM